MDRIHILVAGRDKEIVSALQCIIEQHEDWQCTAAYEDEETILQFQQMQYDIVLFSRGIGPDSEKKLKSIFLFQQPEIIILQHYGEGDGLEKEILTAWEKRLAEYKARKNFFDGTLN